MLADTVGVDFINERYVNRWFRNPEDGLVYCLVAFGSRTVEVMPLAVDEEGAPMWGGRTKLDSRLFQDLSIFAYPDLGYRQFSPGVTVFLYRHAGTGRGLNSKLLKVTQIGKSARAAKPYFTDAALASVVYNGQYSTIPDALTRLLNNVPYNQGGAEAISDSFAIVATPLRRRPSGEGRVYEIHYAQKCVGTVHQDGTLNITSGAIRRLLAKVA